MNEPEMLRGVFKKGDRVNLKGLLFNQQRDYLIKYNSNQVVKAEQLEGKMIVIHFVLLHPDESWRWTNTAHLVEVYSELLSHAPPRPFEVVFVPIHYPNIFHDYVAHNSGLELEQRFDEVFSTMPWPAIPYSDVRTWKGLADCFVASVNCGYLPSSVVISPTGVVLQPNGLPMIRAYGAAAYPFSDTRIALCHLEDNEVRNCPSLEALLVSPERNYVINNRGDKVNVCDLEDKVVALYLYEDGCTDNDLTAYLEKAYRRCVREKMDFEVVLIYIHDSPNTFVRTDIESFTERFKTMPWLALPYKDKNCKKVLRVFKYPIELGGPQPDPSLVIIGPHGNFVERLSASVLMNFGVKAYPFTRRKAYTLQVERVKNLKLKMLFGPEAFFYCNEVSFSDVELRIPFIVFSEPSEYHVDYYKFKRELMHVYLKKRRCVGEFEVIQIGGWDGQIVPWLTMAGSYSWFDRAYKNVDNTFSDILHNKGYGVFCFDRDGKVVRATINPRRFNFARDFPFGGAGLEAEVVHDLDLTCNWIFS